MWDCKVLIHTNAFADATTVPSHEASHGHSLSSADHCRENFPLLLPPSQELMIQMIPCHRHHNNNRPHPPHPTPSSLLSSPQPSCASGPSANDGAEAGSGVLADEVVTCSTFVINLSAGGRLHSPPAPALPHLLSGDSLMDPS